MGLQNPPSSGSGLTAGSVIPADLSTGGPYWDATGNVGIGTSSPSSKLNVNGWLTLGTSNGVSMSVSNNFGSNDCLTFGMGTLGMRVVNSTNTVEVFKISNSGVINTEGNPITQCPTTAKAWVNFNAYGTLSIRSSYNVSSITKNATGDYSINFATPMADANYTAAGMQGGNTGGAMRFPDSGTTMTTALVRVQTVPWNGAGLIDEPYVSVQVFGN